jgi:hypothetical protein
LRHVGRTPQYHQHQTQSRALDNGIWVLNTGKIQRQNLQTLHGCSYYMIRYFVTKLHIFLTKFRMLFSAALMISNRFSSFHSLINNRNGALASINDSHYLLYVSRCIVALMVSLTFKMTRLNENNEQFVQKRCCCRSYN